MGLSSAAIQARAVFAHDPDHPGSGALITVTKQSVIEALRKEGYVVRVPPSEAAQHRLTSSPE